jgi:hypothetical protein
MLMLGPWLVVNEMLISGGEGGCIPIGWFAILSGFTPALPFEIITKIF